MLDLLKNARVRMGALLALLGASGVAFALNQDSCSVNLTPVAADAGTAVEAPAEAPVEAPVEVAPEVTQ